MDTQYQVVVLAGGKGTRMHREGLPKVLVPLKGKPLLSYILDTLGGIGDISGIMVVVGYMAEVVKQTFGEEKYTYAFQEKQLGTAHAVLAAKHLISAENFLVLYGDMPFISKESVQRILSSHGSSAATLTMFTVTVPDYEGVNSSLFHFGRVVRGSDGAVQKIVEFKDCTDEQKQIKEVNPGLYVFRSQNIWTYLSWVQANNEQHEYYLTDVVELALKDGGSVLTVPLPPQEAIGINSEEDLIHAEGA